MKTYNLLFLLILAFSIASCGGDSDETSNEFTLELNANKTEYQLGEKLQASVKSLGGAKIDSVVFFWGDKRIQKITNANFEYTFQNEKLGKWPFTAKIFSNGQMAELEKEITLFNNSTPVTYTYEIVNSFPHAKDAYTQGLEFYRDTLFESTGQYGNSSLRKVKLETGEIYQKIDVPSDYFAEGITILNNKVFQLTWKAGMGFIYDVDNLEKLEEFAYNRSKEGWGLTNDGEKLYKSDGTEKIWTLNAETLAEENFIQTVTNKTIATQLNELEWVEGKIYANTYQKNGVAIINPENGAVEGVINFEGLIDKIGNAGDPDFDSLNDVLNGIAYDASNKKLYVTGKKWDTLFEVKIIQK